MHRPHSTTKGLRPGTPPEPWTAHAVWKTPWLLGAGVSHAATCPQLRLGALPLPDLSPPRAPSSSAPDPVHLTLVPSAQTGRI